MSVLADRARITYLRWLAKEHPTTFANIAAPALKSNLSGLGWIAAVVNAVAQVGSAVVQKKQNDKAFSLQKKTLAAQDAQVAAERAQSFKLALLDVNTKRAQAGLPPVDSQGNPISPTTLPTPSVLAPFASAGTAVSKWGPWILGGGVVVAALFFWRNR